MADAQLPLELGNSLPQPGKAHVRPGKRRSYASMESCIQHAEEWWAGEVFAAPGTRHRPRRKGAVDRRGERQPQRPVRLGSRNVLSDFRLQTTQPTTSAELQIVPLGVRTNPGQNLRRDDNVHILEGRR
jgi:hypothetical protein